MAELRTKTDVFRRKLDNSIMKLQEKKDETFKGQSEREKVTALNAAFKLEHFPNKRQEETLLIM